MPLAPMSSFVSCMSCASLRISAAVGSATGALGCSSTGFPIRAIRKTAMLLLRMLMVAQLESPREPRDADPAPGERHDRFAFDGHAPEHGLVHGAADRRPRHFSGDLQLLAGAAEHRLGRVAAGRRRAR